eukprot:2681222-Pyramimonas_sp.AAC.2
MSTHSNIPALFCAQSLVIAVAVLIHNLSMLGESGDIVNDAHLFSAYLMLPFIATTLALLVFNWYVFLHFPGPPVPMTARVHPTPQIVFDWYFTTGCLLFPPMLDFEVGLSTGILQHAVLQQERYG